MSATTPPPPSQAPIPPYPAAISLSGGNWQSHLAHDGTIPLIHPQIHIGLLETNDVILTDPAVSRMHAVIEWAPEGFVIRDLGSHTGTFVQGQRIAGPRLLAPGEHIRIGATDIYFQAVQVLGSALPSAPPAATDASAPGVIVLPMHATTNAVAQAQSSGFRRGLARHGPKLYWRVFLAGLAVFFASWLLLEISGNPHLVPLVALSAGAVVPVTFVTYCWDQGAFVDMPATIVGLAFISGATLGLIAAATLELPVLLLGIPSAFVAGFVEEPVKVLAVVWFLRNPRLRSELDGLVLGAAVGMGFSALESAGYGVAFFLKNFVSAPHGAAQTRVADAVAVAGLSMGLVLILRMLVAIFGHGLWTGIICAAIWRERRGCTLRITWGVVLAFALAVALHVLWDGGIPILRHIFVAVAGVLLFRFFLRESVERAKQADGAPAPPLGRALWQYFRGLFSRHPRPVAAAESFV